MAQGWKLTDWLAVYAAVLSTSTFAWNLIQSRSRLKVEVMYSVGAEGNGVRIFVQNLSGHDVYLSGVTLYYPYSRVPWRRRLKFMWKYKKLPRRVGWVQTGLKTLGVEDGCPRMIEARNSHSVLILDEKVDELLAKAVEQTLIAMAQDSLFRNSYSKPFKLK